MYRSCVSLLAAALYAGTIGEAQTVLSVSVTLAVSASNGSTTASLAPSSTIFAPSGTLGSGQVDGGYCFSTCAVKTFEAFDVTRIDCDNAIFMANITSCITDCDDIDGGHSAMNILIDSCPNGTVISTPSTFLSSSVPTASGVILTYPLSQPANVGLIVPLAILAAILSCILLYVLLAMLRILPPRFLLSSSLCRSDRRTQCAPSVVEYSSPAFGAKEGLIVAEKKHDPYWKGTEEKTGAKVEEEVEKQMAKESYV